jgi:hypothetical protein
MVRPIHHSLAQRSAPGPVVPVDHAVAMAGLPRRSLGEGR